jgi:LmbE family N-acetylglucosaminyl deacetylase
MSRLTTTAPTLGLDDVHRLGTIVGVWAHPDDEAYLSAGLMAAATEHGGRVVCVTATRGEHGTDQPEAWPPERLARLRERELAASLATLGVSEHHWLDHRDGELSAVPDDEGVGAVGAVLRTVRADTVVTFGPDGITGHPDHVAVGRWATQAGRELGATVLHATTTDDWADQHAELHARFEVFGPAGPPRSAEHELALAVDLPPRLLDRKVAALRAQASQTTALARSMGPSVYRQWWARECFVRG